MKNGVFWDVTPCGSCNNRRFGGNLRVLHPDEGGAKLLRNVGFKKNCPYKLEIHRRVLQQV
jgi:hypothetical protein